MSADTTLVIAAHDEGRIGLEGKPIFRYTARVVQNVEDLLDHDCALDKARLDFLDIPHWPWFSTIGRAKSFASLLRMEDYIEYPTVLYIIIDRSGVHPMTKRGRRGVWAKPRES